MRARHALKNPEEADLLDQATPSVRFLYRYWHEIRGDRRLPRRADFDPTAVWRLLPGIMLVDVEGVTPNGTGIYRYRLVGGWEVDARGYDPTGLLVDEGFHYSSLEEALADYEAVRTTAEPLIGPIEFVNHRNILVREYSILLPFGTDGETVSQILVYSHRVAVN